MCSGAILSAPGFPTPYNSCGVRTISSNQSETRATGASSTCDNGASAEQQAPTSFAFHPTRPAFEAVGFFCMADTWNLRMS